LAEHYPSLSVLNIAENRKTVANRNATFLNRFEFTYSTILLRSADVSAEVTRSTMAVTASNKAVSVISIGKFKVGSP
jgi:hypothetical protein